MESNSQKLEDVSESAKQGEHTHIHEGMQFKLSGIEFRIERIRSTYITCKPVKED